MTRVLTHPHAPSFAQGLDDLRGQRRRRRGRVPGRQRRSSLQRACGRHRRPRRRGLLGLRLRTTPVPRRLRPALQLPRMDRGAHGCRRIVHPNASTGPAAATPASFAAASAAVAADGALLVRVLVNRLVMPQRRRRCLRPVRLRYPQRRRCHLVLDRRARALPVGRDDGLLRDLRLACRRLLRRWRRRRRVRLVRLRHRLHRLRRPRLDSSRVGRMYGVTFTAPAPPGAAAALRRRQGYHMVREKAQKEHAAKMSQEGVEGSLRADLW